MTVADLKSAGVDAIADEDVHVWGVAPGTVQLPGQVTVEPDLSNAAPFLGAALIAGGTVRCRIGRKPPRNLVVCCRGYLERMGAQVSFPEKNGIRYCEVTGGHAINGLGDFDLTAAGEIAPSLCCDSGFRRQTDQYDRYRPFTRTRDEPS